MATLPMMIHRNLHHFIENILRKHPAHKILKIIISRVIHHIILNLKD